MKAAVDRRRVADVPVGVLLSGGLDSSLIVALLAELGHDGIKTFSIGFESVGKHSGDEFRYSDIIARRFAHRPRADQDRRRPRARRAACTRSRRCRSRWSATTRSPSICCPRRWPSASRWCRAGRAPTKCSAATAGIRRSCRPTMPPSNISAPISTGVMTISQRLLSARLRLGGFQPRLRRRLLCRRPARHPPVDKALQIDTEIMLVDDPVKRVDNMTMASGLEARVPFLDHELVELAARIPAEPEGPRRRQIHPQGGGAPLRAGRGDRPAQGLFPGAVAALSARARSWIMCAACLSPGKARTRGLYKRDFVQHMLRNPEAEMSPKGHSRLWQAALLEVMDAGPGGFDMAFDSELLKKLQAGLERRQAAPRHPLRHRRARKSAEYSFGIEEEYFLADTQHARRRDRDAERAVRGRELVDRRPGHARDAAVAARGREQRPCRRRVTRARSCASCAARSPRSPSEYGFAIMACGTHPTAVVAHVAAEPEAALRGDDRGSPQHRPPQHDVRHACACSACPIPRSALP